MSLRGAALVTVALGLRLQVGFSGAPRGHMALAAARGLATCKGASGGPGCPDQNWKVVAVFSCIAANP